MAECDQGRAHRKAVHLLICRINVIRGKEKTEFNIERMLNSILGQMANLLLMDTMHHVLMAWCIVLWVQV